LADPIRIWIEVSHNAALRCGGWAFVRAEGGAMTGAAGGERTGSPERMALAGLAEALKGLPASAAVEIHSATRSALAAPQRAATLEAGGDAPEIDLDLWAPLAVALKTRTARVFTAVNAPRTPTAFAVAWAELARDKAKAAGSFSAVIPKSNFAKLRL
jgi:hypothetical protein